MVKKTKKAVMQTIIPIFPLKLVMFPRSRYILHIFEDKYKIMVKKAMKAKEGFGIISMNKEDMYDIGTYVQVNQIINTFENGEFDIVIEGLYRFKLHHHWLHPDGYFEAEIIPYADETDEVNPLLVEELKFKFEELINKIDFTLDTRFWALLESAPKKSYKIAEKGGLDLTQQQRLLSLRSEDARISFLMDHFDTIENYVTEKARLQKIVMNDGYLI